MNQLTLKKRIQEYEEKLRLLDEKASGLNEKEKAEYQSAKRRFQERLRAWQKTLGSELAVFKHNTEEGYHEVESHIIRKQLS